MKNFPSTRRNCSFSLRVALAAYVAALTPCHTSLAEDLFLSELDQSNEATLSEASPVISSPGDIFQGATNQPEIDLPLATFGDVPKSAGEINSRVVAKASVAIGDNHNSNHMGTFHVVGAASKRDQAGVPSVGHNSRSIGSRRTSNPTGAKSTVPTGNSGAPTVTARGRMQSQTQPARQGGGAGFQSVAGTLGGVAGTRQGVGRLGQGNNVGLGGNQQGLQGQPGNGIFANGLGAGMLGNGIGSGPFGQFMGQNNQLMQGLQFLAILQQILGMFLSGGSGMPFNNANTGQSAMMGFANLMGANGGSNSGSPFGPPAPGACDNSQAYRDQYQRVYNALQGTRFAGPQPVIPYDGARYGITTGSREQWANFFTRLARVESGYNPNTSSDINGGSSGSKTSFGLYQMGRAQFNTYGGGDIFNANDNTNAFVRYAESMYFGDGAYGRGGGRNVIGGRAGSQWLGISAGYGPLRRTTTNSQNANESFLLAAHAC